MRNFKGALLVTIVVVVMVFSGCSRMNGRICKSVPPPGAIVLFDGTGFSHWTKEDGTVPRWKIADDAMEVVPGKGSIMTKRKFRDFKLHVEFNVPQEPPEAKGEDSGNSGVYLQRRYEVQIRDSYGTKAGYQDCGALYKTRAPDKSVCKKPRQWQSYDITFRAARFERENKVENVRITVFHNGILIHDDVELADKTGLGRPEGHQPGPILLQDHGSKVRFRNIWIVPHSTE